MFLALTFIGNTAIATNNFETEITSENSEDWVEMTNEKGILVLFLESEENGKSYLTIKFENTSSSKLKFDWSLNKGTDVVVNNSSNLEIQSLGVVTKKILISEGSLVDFSITMNFK